MGDLVKRLREGCPIETASGQIVGRTKPNPHEYEAADRIAELEALTDWVCIHCHQRNIGGTQCCPDWDGTTVNSRIRELENDLAERIEWCAEIDALAVKQKAQLEAVKQCDRLRWDNGTMTQDDNGMFMLTADVFRAIGESDGTND
jgi:hypothetical protein